MSPDRGRAHLLPVTLLDLLEDRLAALPRRAAEAHLGRPCAACRERLLALAELTGRMRADRMEDVPAELRRAAIQVFTPPATLPADAAGGAWRRLVMAFDSLAQPLAAAARRSVGEARRMRFELAGAVLELECEPESADQCVIRGRLAIAEPELHRIEVRARDERVRAWAEPGGAFLFEGLPRGECRITVSGPEGRFETPPFET